MATTATRAKENSLPENRKKWGSALMNAGWTAFPNVIVERQQALGLDSIDINILLFLSTFWWQADNPPWAGVKAIADTVGIKHRSVQRRIALLVAGGFLIRERRVDAMGGQLTNRYLLSPLIEKAEPFAVEKLARRAAKKSEEAQTRTRKRPLLRPVK